MTQPGTRNILPAVLPPLVDGLTLLVVLSWLPAFAFHLEQPSGLNALLLVLLYLLFCVGVYFIRRLESKGGYSRWRPPELFLNRKIRALLAFFFGLLMMTTLAYQIGYFESIQSIRSATLDEGDSSALLVYMPGALLGFSMLYVLVLAFPVQANISEQEKKYPTLAFLGLALSNVMLIFAISQAKTMVDAFGLPNQMGIFLASLLVLLFSFAPPRLLYQDKQPFVYGQISFLLLILITAWQVVR